MQRNDRYSPDAYRGLRRYRAVLRDFPQLPRPARSIGTIKLASSSFAATGDLALGSVALAAFCGAVLGDNMGYQIARLSGDRMTDWLARNPKRAALRTMGQIFMIKWGGSSVFFLAGLWPHWAPTLTMSVA